MGQTVRERHETPVGKEVGPRANTIQLTQVRNATEDEGVIVKHMEVEMQDGDGGRRADKNYKSFREQREELIEKTVDALMGMKVEVPAAVFFENGDILKRLGQRQKGAVTLNTVGVSGMEIENPGVNVNMILEEDLIVRAPLGYLVVRIEGQRCEVLLDSGAEVNVMPTFVADELRLNLELQEGTIYGIGGKQAGSIGQAHDVEIAVGPAKKKMSFYVVPDQSEIIFGKPFDFTFGTRYDNTKRGSTQGEIMVTGKPIRMAITQCKTMPSKLNVNDKFNKSDLIYLESHFFLKNKELQSSKGNERTNTLYKRVADKV